jgi:hypothetical protein
MSILEFHRNVATIALRVAGRHGFALGGGNALMAHGIVDRLTEDVDLFTDRSDGVLNAADAVEAELSAAGMQTERRDKTGGLADLFPGMGDEMADWLVTRPDGEQMTLQMAYIGRCNPPVAMDVGPVLDLEDVLGSKICALASRVATRDYIDTAAALQRYSVEELITYARRLDAGLSRRDFADAGRRLDDMPDERFAPYGLTGEDVARLRERFRAWPRS